MKYIDSDREQTFDSDWLFFRGDGPGAERPDFDDSAWRCLDLPHDWSIEEASPGEFRASGEGALWIPASIPARIGPFDALRSAGQESTGWTVGGIGWYRRHFAVKDLPEDSRLEIVFDGVYMDSDVWLNGELLGNHPYGYTPFAYDLTPHLRRDDDNVLAVRVRNEGKNSRWYSGSGIYRRVRLLVTGAVRVPLRGVFVTTPFISERSATVAAAVTVENHREHAEEVTVRIRLYGPDNSEAGMASATRRVGAGASVDITLNAEVTSPRLWSPESPELHRADVELIVREHVVDRTGTVFGIRRIEMDAHSGLRINGHSVKLRGACVHHDNGILGAAAIERAEERRVELLKANGFNAVRSSHNPVSTAFLEACDRLGMLVIDEAFDQWEIAKKPDDYHRFFRVWWQRDIEAMVLRGRNHPSVLLWSIGNEIKERADPEGVEIARRLREAVVQIDPTRGITAGICGFWDHADRQWSELEPAFLHLDAPGYNYKCDRYESEHALHPERVMIGTETYARAAFYNEAAARHLPYVIGDFVWTGLDYLGESGIGHTRLSGDRNFPIRSFPWFNGYCGDIDLIGQKKPQSYYRDVVWGRSRLEVAVARPLPLGRTEEVSDWGWPDELRSWTWLGCEGTVLTVRVYAGEGDRVRLLLNDQEVGTQTVTGAARLTAIFEVPYAPGELRAIALDKDGTQTASLAFRTTGIPSRLRLRTDREHIRASRDDLSFVTVEVTDEKGLLVPDAALPVRFQVSGAGELAAVGNANPQDVSSFRQPLRCKTFQGRCLAILRPVDGSARTITLRADSPEIPSVEAAVQTVTTG
jgi:beta-galactosidase